MFLKCCLLLLLVDSLNSAALPNGNDVERLGQIIATTMIYRHGDRNPASPYPGDLYNISYWPEGLGQLTNLGKRQQFALGQWSRARYQNLLGGNFHVNDVYVRSSDVDRTIMSAQANLAGLFPPSGNEIWNKNIPWQPIPVHVVPANDDYILGGVLPPCRAFDNAYDAYLQSDEFQKFNESIQPIFEYLTESLGVPVNDFLTVLMIRDGLFIENVYNLQLPAWSKSLFPNNAKFNDAALKFYHIHSSTKFMAKFRSGYLLKDILDRYAAKVEGTLSPNLKYYAYSSHDSVLVNFLNSLGVYDHKYLPYAAAIILELRYYQNEYYVQLYYKNSVRTPEPINIPGCGTACPLSAMYELYEQILPKNDFNTECNIVV